MWGEGGVKKTGRVGRKGGAETRGEREQRAVVQASRDAETGAGWPQVRPAGKGTAPKGDGDEINGRRLNADGRTAAARQQPPRRQQAAPAGAPAVGERRRQMYPPVVFRLERETQVGASVAPHPQLSPPPRRPHPQRAHTQVTAACSAVAGEEPACASNSETPFAIQSTKCS